MNDAADARLNDIVARALPSADAATVAIVAACAGLLAGVAYADRDFAPAEASEIERLLGAVDGLGPEGARAIVGALEAHRVELASVHAARFARTLRELGTRELRVHVLSMLVSLAASDDTISHSEQNTMRQVTRALGLTQDDYNRLQSEHRARLSTLR
ncbi:MAG TPA: TerB family tellurite resistance protein [Polyangiaceae bacterium]|jgi:uncharacterized tellurite resistance protein B-like protein|nr:TerB family tellurite resistance protein [Polyangiaceae bacterium]